MILNTQAQVILYQQNSSNVLQTNIENYTARLPLYISNQTPPSQHY